MISRLCALVACALLVAGCGSSGDKPQLTVSAAASLTKAFTVYGHQFSAAAARFSFAGSDQLAAQIEHGATPDLFASANTKLPALLYAKHLVERPVPFATNRLVIAVPSSSTKINSLADLAKPGVTIAVGSPSVPIGAYTRTVLARLGATERQAILANVRSNEPDVTGIVGKLTQRAVDAGFVYVTDARAAHLRAIELSASLQPSVAYAIAIVRGTTHSAQANEFIQGLLNGQGATALREAGFAPPPG